MAIVGASATIACPALKLPAALSATTEPPECFNDRTAALRTTLRPKDFAARIETCWAPPTKRQVSGLSSFVWGATFRVTSSVSSDSSPGRSEERRVGKDGRRG